MFELLQQMQLQVHIGCRGWSMLQRLLGAFHAIMTTSNGRCLRGGC